MDYPCGFGSCKGGSLLIHAGQTEEEPTLCKNHPSTELRAGPSAPVKHAGRKKARPGKWHTGHKQRAGLRAGPSAELRAGKGAAPRMHLGGFAGAISNRSRLAPEAE